MRHKRKSDNRLLTVGKDAYLEKGTTTPGHSCGDVMPGASAATVDYERRKLAFKGWQSDKWEESGIY